MASIILSTAGSAAGRATGLTFAPQIGSLIGRTVGNAIDNRLFSPKTKIKISGSRLSDLGVQSSAYGKMIPIIYGTVRLSGNIIWSRPIKETATTSRASSGGGKGGGGRVAQSTTSYSYYVTLAVAVCEGELSSVHRIWADAKQLDLSQYTHRVYLGSETQMPDSLISSFEGASKTPAYRGLAYIVFEDFPLADFGNRIPNFTFEVQKKALYPDYADRTLEDEIKAMVLIPGAGEFVYDTQVANKVPGAAVGSEWAQQGSLAPLNMHNPTGAANALLALDQMQDTCPNLEWVSVVVGWFGDALDAGACIVQPGVEFKDDAIISPQAWGVAGYTRATARLITQISGAPQFGGTPDDASLVRLVTELRTRGLKVAFYPLIFMDMAGKPWRGELTGSASDVAAFFTKTNGYNTFINHYVSLLDGKVDAFIIGSELKGLTRVTDTPGVYPAVNALVSLAASVKAALGSSVKVTYAADWSEYHHTDGGWYHLDPLWASPNIDVVGVDAYFPLSNAQSSLYDVDEIKDGWTSGEGYDFYFSDPARSVQTPLAAAYAWKNISWFYHNTHTNPDATTTAWTPGMKKIWFTEVGYPSVDACTNQPNVFYDPNTSGSAFPYFSKGRVDSRAQRSALMAAFEQWRASSMVDQMFVWTWDARPFPYWPDFTKIWTDGGVWKTGHWVQGKLGVSKLSAIVADLCARAGLDPALLDVRDIAIPVEGYVISSQQSIRECVETLARAFFFDSVESDYQLRFISRGQNSIMTVADDDLVLSSPEQTASSVRIKREQEVDLPKRVNVMYINRSANFQTGTQYAQRETTRSKELMTLDFPIVLSDQVAKNIADVTLYNAWLSRVEYRFTLPPSFIALDPADVVTLNHAGTTHTLRLTSLRLVDGGIAATGVAEDVAAYDFYLPPGEVNAAPSDTAVAASTTLHFLDIPALPGDAETDIYLRFAACGLTSGWNGAAIYRSDDGGANYVRLTDAASAATLGTAAHALASGVTHVFDEANTIQIYLLTDSALSSTTEIAVLNGANAALVGSEIIQFKNATLVGANSYVLSGLLRGRLGTEWAVGTHIAGERFVLLDDAISKVSGSGVINLARHYKAVTYGGSLGAAASLEHTYTGLGYKPYSPVHVEGVRDGAGNLTIYWIRRTRIGGSWRDYVDVPLSEANEAYEVEILNGSAVVRTIAVTAPSATYSAIEQTADFGSPQASLSVRVYQRSAMIGRGTETTKTI